MSNRLKLLEEKGIVARERYSTVPLKVEYTLTRKGKALESIVESVEEFVIEYYG